jgi:uncharacterized Zn finger protein
MKKWIEGRCQNCKAEFSVPLRMVNDGHFIECLSCGRLTPIFFHTKKQELPRLTYKPRKKNKKGGGYININGGYLKARR